MSHSRKTTTEITAQKNTSAPLVCLTAYTAPMAKTLDRHCDLLLVGDSLGMALYGMENTLGVTLDIMINHGKAVMRVAQNACVVVDMPFGTYEQSPEVAYKNALRIITETGCDAVKLEGGQDIAPTIAYITERNIPVMAHIGLQPQSVLKDGGYKIKGRTNEEVSKLLGDAKAIEKAGAFAVVIEGTIDTVAKNITQSIDIPTIGIGASVACDGQILVTEDMLGITTDHIAKFVKQYATLAQDIDQAAANYAADVKSRTFPDEKHIYKAKAK
ncbi:MAG: 3-methyl-2-oxobutanoate hydroxymethyltransferase [Zetaproteobacteria bacterium]|nr:MAG: 3-methyl-2-oxobutanoate hydroxymethyltransferase [Zetaproteobacteria bacterium]